MARLQATQMVILKDFEDIGIPNGLGVHFLNPIEWLSVCSTCDHAHPVMYQLSCHKQHVSCTDCPCSQRTICPDPAIDDDYKDGDGVVHTRVFKTLDNSGKRLQEQIVLCQNALKSCAYIGCLKNMLKHHAVCQFSDKIDQCDCGLQIERKNFSKHKKFCRSASSQKKQSLAPFVPQTLQPVVPTFNISPLANYLSSCYAPPPMFPYCGFHYNCYVYRNYMSAFNNNDNMHGFPLMHPPPPALPSNLPPLPPLATNHLPPLPPPPPTKARGSYTKRHKPSAKALPATEGGDGCTLPMKPRYFMGSSTDDTLVDSDSSTNEISDQPSHFSSEPSAISSRHLRLDGYSGPKRDDTCHFSEDAVDFVSEKVSLTKSDILPARKGGSPYYKSQSHVERGQGECLEKVPGEPQPDLIYYLRQITNSPQLSDVEILRQFCNDMRSVKECIEFLKGTQEQMDVIHGCMKSSKVKLAHLAERLKDLEEDVGTLKMHARKNQIDAISAKDISSRLGDITQKVKNIENFVHQANEDDDSYSSFNDDIDSVDDLASFCKNASFCGQGS